MANKLLSMHKLRQILIFLERGVSIRNFEKEVKVSRKTIGLYQQKFLQTGLGFSELLQANDKELERLIDLVRDDVPEDTDPRKVHFYSLIEYFTHELKRTGVTRLLLWEEYIRENPTGLQYSRFCKLLQDHIRVTKAVMHFEHQPARMMQVDFAGDQLYYVDPSTGELVGCPVLVAVLPFSGYGYVEALPNMKLVQVVKALNNALDYFGGVPLGAKSDNMKRSAARQWVSRSSRYDRTADAACFYRYA